MDNHHDIEEWRPVERHPNYEVSSLGRVRRSSPGPGAVVGRVLKHDVTWDGYRYLKLGRGPNHRIAALVCAAWHGPRPPGLEVRHLDGSRDNDRPDNLAWGTAQDNSDDKRRHGTMAAGEKNGRATMTEADALAIRREYALAREGRGRVPAGWRPMIAARYGISLDAVSDIASGKTW